MAPPTSGGAFMDAVVLCLLLPAVLPSSAASSGVAAVHGVGERESAGAMATTLLVAEDVPECMGALLERRQFVLTTAQCAAKMRLSHEEELKTPIVKFADQTIGVKCTRDFEDRTAPSIQTALRTSTEALAGDQDLALLELHRPFDARKVAPEFGLHVENLNRGDKCNLVLASADDLDVPVLVQVTVVDPSECEAALTDPETSLCFAVTAKAKLCDRAAYSRGAPITCFGKVVHALVTSAPRTALAQGDVLRAVPIGANQAAWVSRTAGVDVRSGAHGDVETTTTTAETSTTTSQETTAATTTTVQETTAATTTTTCPEVTTRLPACTWPETSSTSESTTPATISTVPIPLPAPSGQAPTTMTATTAWLPLSCLGVLFFLKAIAITAFG